MSIFISFYRLFKCHDEVFSLCFSSLFSLRQASSFVEHYDMVSFHFISLVVLRSTAKRKRRKKKDVNMRTMIDSRTIFIPLNTLKTFALDWFTLRLREIFFFWPFQFMNVNIIAHLFWCQLQLLTRNILLNTSHLLELFSTAIAWLFAFICYEHTYFIVYLWYISSMKVRKDVCKNELDDWRRLQCRRRWNDGGDVTSMWISIYGSML